jgi:hypothetical protein
LTGLLVDGDLTEQESKLQKSVDKSVCVEKREQKFSSVVKCAEQNFSTKLNFLIKQDIKQEKKVSIMFNAREFVAHPTSAMVRTTRSNFTAAKALAVNVAMEFSHIS